MNTLPKDLTILETFNFSADEKLSILRFSNMIAAADGKVHKGEITFMVDLIENLKLPISAPLEANNLSFDDVASTIKKMTINKKVLAFEIFKSMIESDNEVHEKEVKIFHKLRMMIDPKKNLNI
ncbi:tellurite resistance TerB family protein [Flammeovirga pacifica]|uniref:Co-chaperone DjlA N-terminal domain-containing protein n=1 Tax=Flammeovirga pacifica TaxID=915059 RepID=A0A1S1YSS0_FLAPC|nr:TerB family tellurite resistance protein [Flammeovirga pacifica]OHX64058.1 hypothetical protein NH26_20840 [Flammeovirga pacifica]